MSAERDRLKPESIHSLNATEHAIGLLWAEVLQLAGLPDPTDNFFAVGGDSITMIMLEFRIKEELSVDLPAGTLLNAPSVRQLSTLVDAMLGESQARCAD